VIGCGSGGGRRRDDYLHRRAAWAFLPGHATPTSDLRLPALRALYNPKRMAGPPPPLRDHHLDLVTLSAMARTFDQISREDGGQLWPATAFVEWLADEWVASAGEKAAKLTKAT